MTLTKWKYAPAAILAALVLTTAVDGADRTGQYAVKGVGQAPCADFARAMAGNPAQTAPFLQWLAGYLSAANQYETATYDVLAWQTDSVLAGALTGYCRANPKTAFAQAAAKMVDSLRASRVVQRGRFKELVIGTERVRLYDETVLQIKALLARDVGFTGPKTPLWDKPTVDAVMRFQTRHGLPASGQPTSATLIALFAPPPATRPTVRTK